MAGDRVPEAPAFRRLLAEVADVAGLLWDRGWAERNAGNISCDVTDVVPTADSGEWRPLSTAAPELSGRRLLVTAAGCRMRDVAKAPERWCLVLDIGSGGAAFRTAWCGPGEARPRPTSELPAHLSIHGALRRRLSSHRAVLHAHPAESLAITHDRRLLDEGRLNALFRRLHPEVVMALPDGVAVVPYRLPGSVEQGIAAGTAMERHDVALWEKHGAVAAGPDPAAAFDLVDMVNKAARLLLMCRAAGYEPEGLSEAQVDELRRAYPPPGS